MGEGFRRMGKRSFPNEGFQGRSVSNRGKEGRNIGNYSTNGRRGMLGYGLG